MRVAPNPALETAGNGRRLRIVVQNTGEGSARACQLTIRYDWRVDHESATATRLEETFPIDALSPSGQWVVLATVPDERIRRNPPFGSSQVRITLTADAAQTTTDADRTNNSQNTQISIIDRR
ncbi:MAG: hypothetical protein H7Z72_01805 [Bacteroidetes bacterium]|nr:hypothetical protein [Fibrella sp.]